MTDYHVIVYESTPAEETQAMSGRWVQRNTGGTANGACVSMLKEVPPWKNLQALVVVPFYFH